MTQLQPAPPQGRRSDAWGSLAFSTWALAGTCTLSAVALSRNAWDRLLPLVIPARQTVVFGAGPPGLTVVLLVALGLSVVASIPFAVLTVAFALTAVPDRRGNRGRLGALIVTVAVLVAVTWWWTTDHTPESGSFVPPGAAYYLLGSAVILGLAVLLVLELYLLIRPVCVRPPTPASTAAPGWYTDPESGAAWRWWDGSTWGPASTERTPGLS